MRPTTTHLSSPSGAGCDLAQSCWDVSSARKCAALSPPRDRSGGGARGGRRKRGEHSEGLAALLTRSGLAQWPFRAVETLPIIRSFICWVASGLSLGKQRNSPVTPHWSCPSFSLGAQSKGTQCLGLRGLPRGKTTESAHKTGT